MDVNYEMGDTVLCPTIKKDLGVPLSADLKVSEQCGTAVSEGNQIVALIRKYITRKKS